MPPKFKLADDALVGRKRDNTPTVELGFIDPALYLVEPIFSIA